jgi:hypothetical protein
MGKQMGGNGLIGSVELAALPMQGYNLAFANYNLHSQRGYLPDLPGLESHLMAYDDNTNGIRALFALMDYIIAPQDYNLLHS